MLPFYDQIIFHCTYTPHFIYPSSADGNLSCVYFLAVVNNAAVNIHKHVFQGTSVSIFRGYVFRSGIAGSCGNSAFRDISF